MAGGGEYDGTERRWSIQKLKNMYEQNLRKIDDELGRDGTEIKLKVMQWRIRDLEEQNEMFCQEMDQFVEGEGAVSTCADDILRLHQDLERCEDDRRRALEEKEELIAEVKYLKAELKKSKAETQELSETVNYMKQSIKDTFESKAEILELFKEGQRKYQKASEFKHVSCSPDCKSEVNNSQPEEQSLCNVPQQIDNEHNDNQQVQSPVNQSDYRLEQVHISDEPQHSFPWKYHSTPKKSGKSCSKKKLCYGGNTDATKYHCDYGRSLCPEHTDLSHAADVMDQPSVPETHYEVCQRNSSPARGRQTSADENDMSGLKIDTSQVENLASEIRYRQKQMVGRHAFTEGHDCTLPHTRGYHNRHSSA